MPSSQPLLAVIITQLDAIFGTKLHVIIWSQLDVIFEVIIWAQFDANFDAKLDPIIEAQLSAIFDTKLDSVVSAVWFCYLSPALCHPYSRLKMTKIVVNNMIS